MEKRFDVSILGGGIVGTATLLKIKTQFPNLKVLLIEKENEIAAHQTGHNSGVIHSGIYYKPGSFKAKNCVDGRRELVSFAMEHHIPHDVCGKVIVATRHSELEHLSRVFNNGKANGVEGIERITALQVKDIEPHCHGIEGIWVPCTGIIDFVAASKKFVELAKSKFSDTTVVLGETVESLEKYDNVTHIKTSKSTYTSNYVINCTGLQCDRIAKLDGVNPDMKIVGFRGDYYELTDKAKHKVRNLIYPVPNPEFPFLGVHFTRMTNGDTECGPNAVFTFKREGYGKTDFNLRDTWDALTYGGTWKLFRKHWRFGLDEYRRAFSKKLFLSRLQLLVPSLTMEDLKPGRAGVRAMALDKDGNMIDDFNIVKGTNTLHVLNAPSPAATACLAIGNEITQMAKEHFKLTNV
ncbi:MAG: L-2-hydroxyglutarate oxidase [Bacteroidetes bacterium]|nr:L-2-hydroxyglutarate oxidase [Bacteroidota bacterium]